MRNRVIWLTGLPCSGKTTIAKKLKEYLLDDEDKEPLCEKVEHLDGDEVRKTLCADLGFSEADRYENIDRVSKKAKELLDEGNFVICSFVSPTRGMRELAKENIGILDFVEVLVDCPVLLCSQRDVKGMYRKAELGQIEDFTGVQSKYEYPQYPDIQVNTKHYTVEECVQQIVDKLDG